jgi:plastocyanin
MAYGVSMHRFARRLTLAIAGALLVLATVAGPSIAVDKWVTMYDNKYLPPGNVTIRVGDTVTWVSDDDVPHDAVGTGWRTPLLNKGDSHAVTFTKAGTYRYSCTIHPEMVGRVVVRAAGGGSGSTTPPTDPDPWSASSATGSAAPLALTVLAAAAMAFLLAFRRAPLPRA